MKTYEVLLSKSYIVEIVAKNAEEANECATLFTSDVGDAFNEAERQTYGFSIESIKCTVNETYGVTEIGEYNGRD